MRTDKLLDKHRDADPYHNTFSFQIGAPVRAGTADSEARDTNFSNMGFTTGSPVGTDRPLVGNQVQDQHHKRLVICSGHVKNMLLGHAGTRESTCGREAQSRIQSGGKRDGDRQMSDTSNFGTVDVAQDGPGDRVYAQLINMNDDKFVSGQSKPLMTG